jgi:hypothetical protein
MSYYQEKLKQGLEYQDFVAEQLYKIGLPIFNYSSQKWQYQKGENKLGVEIKYQEPFSKTGNLWIEIAEKTDPMNTNYIPSGIYRNDNSWLYVTGDYEHIFVFSKKLLKQLFEAGKYTKLENKRKTSLGFLMPKEDAEKYAARLLTI